MCGSGLYLFHIIYPSWCWAAAYLEQEYALGGWWDQMVTVTYEQDRGLRAKHQKSAGYEIGRSKTLAVPLGTPYEAWHDPKKRGRWLKGAVFAIRKATANKSLRVTWVDGSPSVEVLFYSKGDRKSQVTVTHSKLADAAQAGHMKTYWGAALERLQEELEA